MKHTLLSLANSYSRRVQTWPGQPRKVSAQAALDELPANARPAANCAVLS